MLYFISIPPNIATYFTFTFGIFSISLFFLKENPPKIGVLDTVIIRTSSGTYISIPANTVFISNVTSSLNFASRKSTTTPPKTPSILTCFKFWLEFLNSDEPNTVE